MKIVFYTTTRAVQDIKKTAYVAVKAFWGDISPEEIFLEMQGENWSPRGEMNALIQELGASHTSMSVGDYVYDTKTDVYYKVEPLGFKVELFNNLLDFVKDYH